MLPRPFKHEVADCVEMSWLIRSCRADVNCVKSKLKLAPDPTTVDMIILSSL